MSTCHVHEDRDRILVRAEIAEVAMLCGFRKGRWKNWHCGFHGRDLHPSASIRGRRIRCFTCGRSWDAFDLVMQYQGVDFKGALQWLADHYIVPTGNRPQTAAEKGAYAARVRSAEEEARGLVEWRNGLLEALRVDRNVYLGGYHAAKNYIIRNGLDTPLGNFMADAAETYEARYLLLDEAIDRITSAPFSLLLNFYRQRSPGTLRA